MIAVAGRIYLAVNGGIAGAILFSIGLALILKMKFKLFTGFVGSIKLKEDAITGLQILFGNIIGVIVGALTLQPLSLAATVAALKLALPLSMAFLCSIYCGLFVHLAVILYRATGSTLDIVMCVVAFILCGGEHCIADLYYIIAAGALSPYSILFLLIITLGNSIGALGINALTTICEK